jgi:hypothetical protein
LLSRAVWEADEVRDDLRSYVAEAFGEPAGTLVVDLCLPWNYADHRPGEVGRAAFSGPPIGIIPLAS